MKTSRGSLALRFLEESIDRAGAGPGGRAGRGGLQLHQLVVDHDDGGRARRRAGTASRPIPSSAFSDHTGVTATSVQVGNVSTLSLGLFKGAQVGTQAYFDYVNSTGGVNGRKLVLNNADDGFTGASNKQATQNAVQNDFALVGDFSLEDSFGGAVLAQNPGFPDVSQVLDNATNKLPNVYSPIPLADGWASGPMTYYHNKFTADASHAGAFLADSPSAAQTWAGEKYVAEKAGFTFVSEQTYATTQTDFNQQVIAMKNAGVKIIFMDQMPSNYASSVLQGPGPAELPPPGPPRRGHLLEPAGHPVGRRGQRERRLPVPEPRPLPGHGPDGRAGGGHLPALGPGGLARVQPGPVHRLRLALGRPLRPGPEERRVEPQPGLAAPGPVQGHLVQRRAASTPRRTRRPRRRPTAT